jgi:ABC-type sugar transport system ATPase subunit
MAEIKVSNINKNFGKYWVVREFNVDVKDKEFFILVGPRPGAGKRQPSEWIFLDV